MASIQSIYDLLNSGPESAQRVRHSKVSYDTLSAAALNADLIPAVDISFYLQATIDISAIATGATITFQGSNEPTFANPRTLLAVPVGGGTGVGTTTTTGAWVIPLTMKYFRVRQTAWTSGTTLATVVFSSLGNLTLTV